MGTKLRFDSDRPGIRSPYLGRHRKATQVRSAWRLVRRGPMLSAASATADGAGLDGDQRLAWRRPTS
jgi:hypothetical protein